MSDKMKAEMAHDLGEALTFEEVSISFTGPDEVSVEIQATCVCNSRLHAKNSEWSGAPARPVIIVPKDTSTNDVVMTAAPTFDEALQMTLCEESTAYDGRLHDEIPSPILRVVLTRTIIRTSTAGTREDLTEAVAFARAVAAHIRSSKFDGINSFLRDPEAGWPVYETVINL